MILIQTPPRMSAPKSNKKSDDFVKFFVDGTWGDSPDCVGRWKNTLDVVSAGRGTKHYTHLPKDDAPDSPCLAKDAFSLTCRRHE